MDNGASSYRRFLDGDESAFELIMKELFHCHRIPSVRKQIGEQNSQ